jgi:cytosine/adenosine deaminase-related metal-dependent hydrolase
MPGRYLVTGGLVVTLDDSLGDFENGSILIEDGVIKAVGRSEDITADGAEVIDATEGVVIPGMVDTHRHATLSLSRGISVDENAWPFLVNTYHPLVPSIGIEEVRTSTLVSALEALESGITTMNEPSEAFPSAEYVEAGLQSFKESGIRSLYSFGMHQSPYGDAPAGKASWEARLQHAKKLFQEYGQDGLVRVGLHLSQPGTVPMTWLRDEINFAQDQGVFCCSHSACIMGSDLSRDLDVRADMGCMLPGHLYIHCPSLTDHDMSLIAKTGGKIAFATDSNIQTGMGYPPLRNALAHGLKPSLSTDSAMTAPTDMLSTMRLQLQAQRGQDHHAVHLTRQPSFSMDFVTRDALVWGTRNGAEALGLGDKIGTLTPGKRADVVVITSKRRISPSVNPLGTAMLQSTPADVDLVMVDGKIMKRDGRLVGVDMNKIRARAREDSRRIMENLERRRSGLVMQKGEDVVPMLEKIQRACFADVYT